MSSFSKRIAKFLSSITAVKFTKFYYENLNNLIFSVHVEKYSLETDGNFNQHVNK